jgi:hypothetical protein
LDIVLGLREFFHNPHNNRLRPRGRSPPGTYVG